MRLSITQREETLLKNLLVIHELCLGMMRLAPRIAMAYTATMAARFPVQKHRKINFQRRKSDRYGVERWNRASLDDCPAENKKSDAETFCHFARINENRII